MRTSPITRAVIFTAAIMAVSGISTAEARAQTGTGTIEGTVAAGTSAVDDADVSVAALGRRVRVDGEGRFPIEDVPAGTYVIQAESPRWGRAIETVEVRAGETTRLDLSLETVFHLDEIIISAGAGATRRSEAYQPASVVTSRDLVALGEASLGETLSGEPGVTSTYFGPGASRPIIRGIGGDRVRILEGGIGVGDASSTSPDHAVGLEARTADRIEVIRGPATLLYGSSAVGGIVNVLDGKIARERPTQPFSGFIEGLVGTVADERTGTANVTAHGGPVVLNASGLLRNTADYDIPGPAEAGSIEGEGVLENSAIETGRGSIGLTVVGSRGYFGAAWTGQESTYGVPAAHVEEPPTAGADEEAIAIDMNQRRYDVEGALRFGAGAIRNVRVRFGIADYRHVEFEGDVVGTTFLNDYWEGRIESEHALGERFHGALGLQLSSRNFQARGDEAFVPPSETGTYAVFAYEELSASETLRIQGGARLERQNTRSAATAIDRTDNAVSLSMGANWDALDFLTFAVSVSRSVKLPNAEELFSNGPHAATRAFEVGDPTLDEEKALGVDVTAHVHGDRYRGSASIFTTGFADFIYERATGDAQDGLPVFRFVQDDARFSGFELEAELDVVEGNGTTAPHVSLELLADYVTAELTDREENLPRIPPLRVGAGIEFRQGPFVIGTRVRRTTEQTRRAPLEDSTPGFTMVGASASYRIFTGDIYHDLTLVGSNLLDEEARLHTSFLKDLAPLPGREVRLIYRVSL